MSQETFNRIEKKYRLNEKEIALIKKAMHPYMRLDTFGKYKIYNLYFDNEQFSLIRNSLEKPTYKEKLRLRSYKIPKSSDTVFLEIKKKYKKIVNKRREVLSLQSVNDYLKTGMIPNKDSIVLQEIDFMIKRYQLKPVIYLAYNREAYSGKERKDFRITFDKHIRSRDFDVLLEKGDYGEELLDKDEAIMEVKCFGAYPSWFITILNENHIYPISFSKIGEVYKKKMERNVNV